MRAAEEGHDVDERWNARVAPSPTRCCAGSPTRAGSSASAAAARTEATDGSHFASCASRPRRRGARRPRRRRPRARRALRHRLRGRAAPGRSRANRADQRLGLPIVAVDLPSGVDASTGEIAGAAVFADCTVTFHGVKVGLEVAPGRFHAGASGRGHRASSARETEHRLVTRDVLRLVPRRSEGDNKYTAGSVLVVGGAPGHDRRRMPRRRGRVPRRCRLRRRRAPEESLPVLEAAAARGGQASARRRRFRGSAERRGPLALGPGLGEGREALVRRLLTEATSPPSSTPTASASSSRSSAPHPRAHAARGRARAPARRASSWVATHRLEALRRAVERFGCVVLLKGADTLIGAPGPGVLVVSPGPPSLATAGTGDVLTGISPRSSPRASRHVRRGRRRGRAAARRDARAASGRPVAYDVIARLPEALDSSL